MAAPFILLGANITRAENLKVDIMLQESLDNAVLIKTAQEAEVINMVAKVAVAIILEVALKLEALRILMVDMGAGNIAFVGTSFVREHNKGFVFKIGDNIRCKSETGRKWHMAVIVAFLIEFEQEWIDA